MSRRERAVRMVEKELRLLDCACYRELGPDIPSGAYSVVLYNGSDFGGSLPMNGGVANVLRFLILVHDNSLEAAESLADRVEERIAKRGFRTRRLGVEKPEIFASIPTIEAELTT